MILDKKLYSDYSFFKKIWYLQQIKKFSKEKVFKTFRLFKTDWPNKLYSYSPRLKKIPRFSGDLELLSSWKESYFCETICPTHAIKVTQDSFVIDAHGCIACGLCIELAPAGFFINSGHSSEVEAPL